MRQRGILSSILSRIFPKPPKERERSSAAPSSERLQQPPERVPIRITPRTGSTGTLMRSSVLQQAAAEARTGMREIDAEIDRLTAKRELLELLESTAREVLTVRPMSQDESPSFPRKRSA
jgi:hypothetical protein